MEGTGTYTPSTVCPQPQTVFHTAPGAKSSSPFTRASNYLQDSTRVGLYFENIPKNSRYADLQRDEMYTSIVDLYEVLFKTHWHYFDKAVTQFITDQTMANQLERYAACVYVSSWFHDLYVSNRNAVRKLSDAAYNEHYRLDLVQKSTKYDSFLVGLSTHIRPTVIKYTKEETLFVPRLNRTLTPNSLSEDIFGIHNYQVNDHLLGNIIYNLEERKILKMDELSDNTIGRPSWLFDWQNDGLCYAWFPPEGNFNFEDVAAAYIVGVACTSKLGPREYDEWQVLPNNLPNQDPHCLNLRRQTRLSYRGHIEYRAFETKRDYIPDDFLKYLTLEYTQTSRMTRGKVKRKQLPTISQALVLSEPQAKGTKGKVGAPDESPLDFTTLTAVVGDCTYTVRAPGYHMVRCVDYLYYARVITKIDFKSRVAAFRATVYSQK